MRQKVESEMAKARVDIEAKLVPSGPAVIRHLTLPSLGHDPEWIKNEMDNMDKESGGDIDWRHGKLSGAVYHGGADIEVRHISILILVAVLLHHYMPALQ